MIKKNKYYYFFLISTERSGSNFIVHLFNNHRKICAPSPTHLFRLFGLNSHLFLNKNFSLNRKKLIYSFYKAYNSKFSYWSTNISLNLLLRKKFEDVCSILKFAYQRQARKDKKFKILIKENYTYQLIDFILANIPDAKFIYLIRDPRSVAASWLERNIYGGAKESVKIWKKDQIETLKVLSKMNKNKYYTIKYEDIIKRNNKYKKLFNFLDIKYEKNIEHFYKNKDTIINSSLTDEWKNLSKPILKNNHKKFTKVLNKDEIKYVEKECCKLMKLFNYSRNYSKFNFNLNKIRRKKKVVSIEEQNLRNKRLNSIKKIISKKNLFN